MTLIYSEKALQDQREKKRQLQCCDPLLAFEIELKEVQRTWWHFAKGKSKNKFW